MKSIPGTVICVMLVGCAPPPPVSKGAHVMQVRQAIANAGGETNLQKEAHTLFARLAHQTNYTLFFREDSRFFDGLSGVTNLGDAFHYEPWEPDHIRIRVYNSHSDVYFIALLNPDLPEPAGFERIAGNVGFIERAALSNQSPPARSGTNQTSAAAGSGG